MRDEDFKEIISEAKRKQERKFVKMIKKRIAELTIKKNKVVSNSRTRYNFAIGELMFLIQE